MKRFITFLALTCCIYIPLNAQDYIWAKTLAGGAGQFEESKCIITDAAGNIYITGSIEGQAVDFDPGPGTATLQTTGNIYHPFFAKYDINGNYLWAKVLGGVNGNGYSNSIALDASGNIYITGFTNSNTDFDPGVGFVTLNTIGTFFAKYDNNGNYIWAKGATGQNSNEGNSITTDGSGNVYLTGFFYGTVDFDPSPGTVTLTAAITGTTQYRDVFFAKYDNNGNYLWAKNIGGSDHDVGNSIKVDASGNVYLTGYFTDAADFDPGVAVVTLTAVAGRDIYFAKYNSSGTYLWAYTIGGINSDDNGSSLALDASNNVYIGGNFSGAVDFDPSISTATLAGGCIASNHFVAKYTSSGSYLWARTTGTNSSTAGNKTVCNSLALDASNNVYITGSILGKLIDFDPGTASDFLSSEWSGINYYGTDIFFAKYDNSGNYVWAKVLNRQNNGSNYLNTGDLNFGNSIAVSAFGHVHITGIFNASLPTVLDFDPGAGTATLASTFEDIFFAKYNSCPGPTVTASSGTICPGQTYSMSVGGASSYSVNNAAATAYTFSPLSTTIYSVTGTNSLSCSSVNPITTTITVKTSPTVSASNGTICAGNVFTISVGGANTYSFNGLAVSNYTVNPVLNTSYSVTGTGTNGCVSGNTAIAAISVYSLPVISAGNGSICIGNTYTMALSGANTYSVNGSSIANFTFSPTATTNYNITGTGANGCVSNPAVATITVNPLPFINAGSGGICLGAVYNMIVSGASSYSINGNSASNFTFSPASTTNYSVTGTSNAGCVSSNAAVAAVTVYSLPLVSASSGTLCSGQVYTIIASGANTYSVNGNAANTFTFNPSTNTTYSITGTSIQGCASSNTAIASLSVTASPTVSVNSPSICAGSAATLTASGANLYAWSNSQTGSSINVTPALTSTYTVTGTSNNNGCTNAVTATVTVHSTNISLSSSSTICINETRILTASGANSYTWSTSENGMSISVSPSITTTYSVQGLDNNGCLGSNSVILFVDECTGISELKSKDNEWRIYPNPVSEILNIESNNSKTTSIFLYDVCGKEIMRGQTENKVVSIDVSALQKGIYFIKIGAGTHKFVKE